MKSNFIPYGNYIDILNVIGKWKIIDLKNLSDQTNFGLSYKTVAKKVKDLEDHKYIKAVGMNNRRKYVYLSDKGIKLTPYDNTYEISDPCLNHDILVGKILRQLCSYDNFYNPKMFHEIADHRIEPDAAICYKDKNIAVELELTQKSHTRVDDKYFKYYQNRTYDYGLFISNKIGLFNTYKRFLKEMNSEVQNKIILVHCHDLNVNKLNLKDSDSYILCKESKFGDFFEL